MQQIDQFIKYLLEHRSLAVVDSFNMWVSYTGTILPFEEALEFIRIGEHLMQSPQELLTFYHI